ncbi:MAG: beta-galactosidase [Chloroflexi bacterium]|nr:beta-galactosidase [Chloroflexota bacterium]
MPVRSKVPRLRPVARLLVVVGLLLAALAPAAPIVAAQQVDPRFFSQTNFRIDNDAFWSFFQGRGGVRTFGYPSSRAFKLDGFTVQIFQREVMQLQGDGSVQTLNLLDPGLMPLTSANSSQYPAPDQDLVNSTPAVSDPNYTADIVTFTQQNAPDTFDGHNVNFYKTFSSTVTCADAFAGQTCQDSLIPLFNLQIWGAPTSKPAYDPTNHNFIYQRFQRSIMHYDTGCDCTQALLLADYFKAILTGQNLPPDLDKEAQGSRFYKQYDHARPNSIARPNDLSGSDLTNAFEPQQASAGSAPSTTTATGPAPTAATSSWGYGFHVQMWQFSQDGKDQTAGLIQQAGFNWAKHQVNWDAVELAPGQYDWTELDSIVGTLSKKNVNVLLSLDQAPSFYRSASSGLMPSDPASFGAFTKALATRYKGRVQAYELWNEPNLARETGAGNVSPATYLPLLKAGAQGVKAADTSAMTILAAPSTTGSNIPGQVIDDISYLQQLYQLNGGEAKQYFDVVGVHPSGYSNPPDCNPDTPACSLSGQFNNDPSFFAFHRVGQYRDVMTQNGDTAKKIWFTEFGYCSNPSPPAGYEYCSSLTEQNQADFLVRAYQKARSLDYVGGMMVWNLNFQLAVGQTDEKWGFGIIRKDWSGRPAFNALQAMAKS